MAKTEYSHESPETLSHAVRRGELLVAKCPSRDVLKHVTSLWGVLTLLILREAGSHRFGDLRRRLNGVSEKMLAQTLQSLEHDGFVARTSFPVSPPHTEYELTPLGLAVSERVASLADWIEENMPLVMRARQSRPADHR